jgi:probable rRNA maturation factor
MSIDDPDSEPDPDRPRHHGLRVVVTDGRGRVRRAARLRKWLADVAPPAARGEVVVALVCDRKMRDLNRQYRDIDRPTDVLSFPATAETPADAGIEPAGTGPPAGAGAERSDAADVQGPHPVDGIERHLGDIVIATGVARRQARAAGHALGAELCCLALHGLLHLLGYDHERDTGQMERLEQRLRRQGGLA